MLVMRKRMRKRTEIQKECRTNYWWMLWTLTEWTMLIGVMLMKMRVRGVCGKENRKWKTIVTIA